MSRLTRTLYAKALSLASGVFFQNPDDQADFRRLGILKENVPAWLVNGSGVDVDLFPCTPLPSQPHFLLVARLIRDKGVVEFADAARLVKRQFPLATFELVGPYDSNPSAISPETVAAWEREGVLTYSGAVSDVRHALGRASIYVLPSYREGTPRTVLEAMSMGRPIITTDAPGCRETVSNGVNGLLVPVKDAVALSEAMIDMAKSRELRERMGSASRRIAVEKYDARAVAQSMLRRMLGAPERSQEFLG